MGLFRPRTTEAEVVLSVRAGYFYPCPTIVAIDLHIGELLTHMRGPDDLGEQWYYDARRDIDRLSERRLCLMLDKAIMSSLRMRTARR